MSKKGLGKFILGAGIGATLGILFAPKSGKETREDVKKTMEELVNKAKNLDAEEVKKNIEKKVEDIKKDLANLDKETVEKKVKEQSKKIKKKADDLVDYAVKKGTPVVEEAAKQVKKSTIKTLENITAKLKESEIPETSKKTTKTSK